MSEIFFKELDISEPQYNLEINEMPDSVMVGKMLEGLDDVIRKENPDIVLVYGDTNSTLAGAIAAKQNRIPLVHVEAGLRSHNMKMPEEINRIIADRISDILFCPTKTAMHNLQKEDFQNFKCEIILSGDVMFDAALFYRQKAEKESNVLKRLNLKDYVLVTLHRSENVDNFESLKNIVSALNEINERIRIVLPIHPRTKKRLSESGLKFVFETIEPVGYLDMIQLLSHSKLIMTDSGGLQKESFFFKKNCIILRNETEWTELVQSGLNSLAGTDKNKILEVFELKLHVTSDFNFDFYGNGNAAEIIADKIHDTF
jgi:UDP-GlcNAc3NAcA epimerase